MTEVKNGQIRVANLNTLFSGMRQVGSEQRLQSILESLGVIFFDEVHSFVKTPTVSLAAVGGICVSELGLIDKVAASAEVSSAHMLPWLESMKMTMAIGGMMSYLNSSNLSNDAMYERLNYTRHASVAHLVSMSFVVGGISVAAESELNSQRDLVHLARLTVARTVVQSDPPLVVLYPEYLSTFQEVRQTISGCRKRAAALQTNVAKKDLLEALNLLWPAAKATLLVMTATLRNYQKLVALLQDDGKEEEVKRVLALLNDSLHHMFPELFRPTRESGYVLPAHL